MRQSDRFFRRDEAMASLGGWPPLESGANPERMVDTGKDVAVDVSAARPGNWRRWMQERLASCTSELVSRAMRSARISR